MMFMSQIRGILRFLKIGRIFRLIKRLFYKFNLFYLALKFYFYNSFLTHCPFYSVRTFYLRKIISIKIGTNTSIHMGCFFAGNNISIGCNTVIARNCYLDGRVGFIEIKNNVSIAPETVIISMTHMADSPTFETISKPVLIEDYVWIGTRAIVLPGITLSKGSVVGAGAIVTKDVEVYSVVAGAPATKIGERNKNLNYTLKYFPYFNTDIG